MGIFNDNSQNNNMGGSGQPGLPGQKGDPGIGFKLTADGNFDLDNKQMKNLSGGIDKSDAVNYGQLLEHTENHQNNYHLQPSFTFYKNFGSERKLPRSNTIKIDSNHNHHGLNWVKKEGSDSGFGGQAWVSLKITNNLPVGIYTVVFELFSGISGISGISGSVTQLNNETLFQQVHGDNNYKIITFSHDYQTTHSKAFIQFTSNGQAGEITFQIRYYGSSYNNSTLNFLFFSRVISGRVGTAFNHNLFDVDDVQLENQILYFDDVNLNENKIKSLGAPTEDEDGANKKYVDDEIAKLPHSDNCTLKLDGSRAMAGNLDMANHKIINAAVPTEDEDGANKKYVDDEIAKLPHSDTGTLKLDGSRTMTGNLNMGHHTITGIKSSSADNAALTVGGAKATYLPLSGNRAMQDTLNLGGNSITNIKDPDISDSNYAATVNFVNKTIDDKLKYLIQSSNTSNAFQYVMDDPAGQFYDEDDIKGIKKTNKDYHKINKETYEMQLVLDSSGYYSSRLGINMYMLPNGEYSLVYELYFPNSIDSSTVQISAVSAVETVSKVTTNVFNNHTRSIIHLHKDNNVAPNRLMIDMVLKNKAGVSYANKLTIFVIVYGVSGYVNNVHTSVWDRLFEVTNNSIKFEATIDTDNKQIKNLADPITGTDVLNLNSGNRKYLKVDGTNQMKDNLDKDNQQINNLADGAHGSDAVNVTQLINMTTTTNTEISKVNTNLQNSISNLKKQINNQINNAIAERGYQNSLICVFYLHNNQFKNGYKISTLSDKKIALPSYNAIQNTQSRKPTADDDLNFSYMNYRAKQCLTVDYNLNGKNNLNVFIVFRILDSSGVILNGIFGNDNGGNDRYIAVKHNATPKVLRIECGAGILPISSFPSKASPVTLNFSVLSVHYNSVQVNDSLVYCNGKYISNFMGESNTGGEDTFSIGSISSDPTNNAYLKHIAYFALYHGRFSKKDILIQLKYLCERYKIDHDPITIP